MAKAGSCFFRIGYFFYTRTRVGYLYHRRDVAKAKEKYNEHGHTVIEPAQYGQDGGLQITPVPMAMDNYAYIILDTKSLKCVVVDPGDPDPVLKELNSRELVPDAVLTTHKHWDHSGGNSAMKYHYRRLRVYGGATDSVPDMTDGVSEGDTLEFGRLKFTVKFTPGHTVGHVVYILDGSPFGCQDCLFSGDHLFVGGCGRMFEEPPLTMLKSHDSLIESLKPETLVWPGHEYAKDNLEFACHLEPDNEETRKKYEWVKEQRKKNLRTCPSTLAEEVKYNPFLRTGQESVLRTIGYIEGEFTPPSDAVRAEALAEIRERKDKFKYIM